MPLVRLLIVALLSIGWSLGLLLGRGIVGLFTSGRSGKAQAATGASKQRAYNDAGLSNEDILKQIQRWGRNKPKEVARHYLYVNGLYHPELHVDRMDAAKYDFMFKKLVSKHRGTLNEYIDLLRWISKNDPQRFSIMRTTHPR